MGSLRGRLRIAEGLERGASETGREERQWGPEPARPRPGGSTTRSSERKETSMTELREELKIRPDEGAVEYAERIEAVLEEHRLETGERLTAHGTMPGEGPGEVLERIGVLKTADGIRSAERVRHRAREGNGANRQKENYMTSNASTAADESSRRYRTRSQERDVERAVSEFEATRKRLYRVDGTPVYGDEEHKERLGKLTAALREKVEAVVTEADADAEGYDREVLALSYTDPAETVPASDRGRLETSRAFVKEDCEDMAVPALVERISAVSAGPDRVGQVLHARYGRRRLEALDAELSRRAAEGRPGGAEAAAERRGLAEAVSGLEEQLKDPKRAEREKALKEAAAESRRMAREVRRKSAAADGTDEAARRAAREQARSAF